MQLAPEAVLETSIVRRVRADGGKKLLVRVRKGLSKHRGVARPIGCESPVEVNRDTRCFAFCHPHPAGGELAVVAILNGYRAGDYINHHSDDEPQVDQGMPICTYSFGAAAVFEVRGRRSRGQQLTQSIRTSSGQRIVMAGSAFQSLFTHGLPERLRAGYRASVTVRACRREALGGEYDFADMALPLRWRPWPPRRPEERADACWRLAAACCSDALELQAAVLRARSGVS